MRAGLVLLALLALLLPLRSLTSSRAPAEVLSAGPTATVTRVRLVLTATSAPFHFAISHLGKVIWEGDCNENSCSTELALHFPPEGIDLLVAASWSAEKEAALRVEVTPNDASTIAQTLWGTARVDDILTFVPTR